MRNPITSLAKRAAKLRPFPALVRRRGAVFLVDPQNWIDNRLIADAPFEQAQIARARTAIQEHGIDLVLDIGANIGLYTALLGQAPSVREVHAFEPVRRNYCQLMGNVFANNLTGKVTAHQCALGDEAARVTIHVDPTSTGLSRLDVSGAERRTGVFTHEEQVEVRRLDDMPGFDTMDRKVFVKIDVEGHAPAVIRGMTRFLTRNHVAIQVELNAGEENGVRPQLEALGYRSVSCIEADELFLSPGL